MVEVQAPYRYSHRIFLFLVAYRWASLLPPLLFLFGSPPERSFFPPVPVFALAAGITLLITLWYRRLNRLLVQRPTFLSIDLLLAAGLVASSGGLESPYYLYALSPLLAGAFFFQIRGALISSAAFAPLYLLALSYGGGWAAPLSLGNSQFFTQLAALWLIPVLVGYPARLLKRLREAGRELQEANAQLSARHEDLAKANRKLEIIHDLTNLLQSAPDVWTVQARILQAATHELGFSRAVVALVDPLTGELGSWSQAPPSGRPPPDVRLPLHPESGDLARALVEQTSCRAAHGSVFVTDAELAGWIGAGDWLCYPFILRDNPVGALLVDLQGRLEESPEDPDGMLQLVASQAAVSLGTTTMCIDRAQRLAVEQERNRIARDIHDTVAQSLFGIVFSLDACTAMLPEQPDVVRQELTELRELASSVRREVRRSIYDLWPSELNLERYKADLASYVSQSCRSPGFQVDFHTRGDFDGLSPSIRRALFRTSQEALTNAARHSGSERADVWLDIQPGGVSLRIEDRGSGFVANDQMRGEGRSGFGLAGMQERVEQLGGACRITSRPGEGTQVQITLPLQERRFDDLQTHPNPGR